MPQLLQSRDSCEYTGRQSMGVDNPPNAIRIETTIIHSVLHVIKVNDTTRPITHPTPLQSVHFRPPPRFNDDCEGEQEAKGPATTTRKSILISYTMGTFN